MPSSVKLSTRTPSSSKIAPLKSPNEIGTNTRLLFLSRTGVKSPLPLPSTSYSWPLSHTSVASNGCAAAADPAIGNDVATSAPMPAATTAHRRKTFMQNLPRDAPLASAHGT